MAHLAVDAWESLLRAQVTLMKEFAEDFRGAEVSMQEYDVLYTLTTCPEGRTRLRDLAEHVRLSQPGLSRLVERMEDDGLVARERDPQDGRGTLVALTAQGRQAQRSVGRVHAAAIVSRVTGSLTPDEQAELARLCTKLRAGAPRTTTRSGARGAAASAPPAREPAGSTTS